MTPLNLGLRLGLALALLTSSARAQNTTILFEDFENGVPAGWQAGGPGPGTWHLAQNGECGAVTRMIAFNAGSPTCSYAGASALSTPDIIVSGNSPWQVAFDYILDIDSTGDAVGVSVRNGSGVQIVFADTSDFVNDGALHSIVLNVPIDSGALLFGTSLSFSIDTDGVGNLGRGWLIDNVRFSSSVPGSIYCSGSPTECPCGNAGGPQSGCMNSTGFGVALRGSGLASISADSFRLGANDVPPGAPALFFGGSAQTASPFGDGRRCVGGSIVRLGTKSSSSGNAVYPEPGDLEISVRSMVPAGATRYYQVLYRNVSGPCGHGFNLSNGWQTTWSP